MARNAIAKVTWSEDEQSLLFVFANGKEYNVHVADFPEGLYDSFRLHGMEQKFRDSYAGAKSVDDAIAAFRATVDTCKLGDWGKRREGAGPAQPALTVEAVMLMAETLGKPFINVDAAKLWIAKMKEAKKLGAVKQTAEYVAAENAVRTARAKTSVADLL